MSDASVAAWIADVTAGRPAGPDPRGQVARPERPTPAVNIVLTEPPGPTSQFVEAETDDGRSVAVGEWGWRGADLLDEEAAGRLASLRITAADLVALLPVSFAVRLDEPRGAHVRVDLFAGRDAEHRALCGHLVMRVEEAEALRSVLGPAR